MKDRRRKKPKKKFFEPRLWGQPVPKSPQHDLPLGKLPVQRKGAKAYFPVKE